MKENNMKKFYQSEGSKYVLKEVKALAGEEKALGLFNEANQNANLLHKQHKATTAFEQMHLNMIIERVALYQVLKREYPDQVWAWMDELARLDSQQMRQFVDNFSSSSILKRIFMPMMRFMTKRVFGKPAGFDQVITESTKDSFAFDLYACPYHKWCTKLGEEELTKNFCDADHHTYDNLKHFAFSRSQTLGYGGKKCDFRYWLK